MNNNNNPQNNKNTNGLTRNFNKQPAQKPQNEVTYNTSANIKKAAAKKAIKKGGRVTGFCLKKVLQWALNIALTLLLMMTICGVIVGGTFAVYVKNYLIDENFDITGLKDGLDMTTKIFCANEEGVFYELEDERIFGTENRSWVSFRKMPKNLYNAFVAIEDERFFSHSGVDWKRTLGACLEFATGNDSYGGSTITQQLIKNVTGEDDTTIQRKVGEIFRALTLSEKRSKEEVLEMYLNTINLSRRNYGVQAAANYYFGKDVADLELIECACLASIPKSPTKYDPVRNPEFNKERRDVVLDKMYELEMISKEELDDAKSKELVLNITLEQSQTESETPYSYYKDALIEQLIIDFNEQYGYSREYASNLIYSGGLQVYVTMDVDVQKAMEEVFEDPESFQTVSDGIQPESAMVVMDPYTGDVLGIVGGRGEKTGRRELNRATQSKRQIGSSIKPITVYAPAMDLGLINYSTVLDDTPFKYMESLGRYWPVNAPKTYGGKITINEAIMKSKNTTAVKVLDMMGTNYAYNFAKDKLHLNSLESSDNDLAPLAMGGLTHGLTVLETTAAYTIFPNSGTYSAPRMYTKVLDSDGTVLLENKIKQEPVISQKTATVMTKIMQNAVAGGTAAAISLDRRINVAGKTGSTNEDKDRYFAGFTPYYVGACWFGYDTPKNLVKFKSNPAMLAWEKVMEKIHQKHFDKAANGEAPLKAFDFSHLKTAKFCLDSGMAVSENCTHDVRTVMLGTSRVSTGYYYDSDDIPTEPCTVHVPVKWDKSQNCLANEYCPEEDVVDVTLLYENQRAFTNGNVPIVDAAYTYRVMPVGGEYPDDAPFYSYTLPAGTYVGYTEVVEGAPINKMCKVHQKPQEPEIPENTEVVVDPITGEIIYVPLDEENTQNSDNTDTEDIQQDDNADNDNTDNDNTEIADSTGEILPPDVFTEETSTETTPEITVTDEETQNNSQSENQNDFSHPLDA